MSLTQLFCAILLGKQYVPGLKAGSITAKYLLVNKDGSLVLSYPDSGEKKEKKVDDIASVMQTDFSALTLEELKEMTRVESDRLQNHIHTSYMLFYFREQGKKNY